MGSPRLPPAKGPLFSVAGQSWQMTLQVRPSDSGVQPPESEDSAPSTLVSLCPPELSEMGCVVASSLACSADEPSLDESIVCPGPEWESCSESPTSVSSFREHPNSVEMHEARILRMRLFSMHFHQERHSPSKHVISHRKHGIESEQICSQTANVTPNPAASASSLGKAHAVPTGQSSSDWQDCAQYAEPWTPRTQTAAPT